METFKAVIREEIISYTASRNKAKKQVQENLIKAILKLDHQYSSNPTPELYKERIQLKHSMI